MQTLPDSFMFQTNQQLKKLTESALPFCNCATLLQEITTLFKRTDIFYFFSLNLDFLIHFFLNFIPVKLYNNFKTSFP